MDLGILRDVFLTLVAICMQFGDILPWDWDAGWRLHLSVFESRAVSRDNAPHRVGGLFGVLGERDQYFCINIHISVFSTVSGRSWRIWLAGKRHRIIRSSSTK